MRKRLTILLILLFVFLPVSAQRIVFQDTIPLKAHIELQEKFTLEINQSTTFALSQDIAGTTHEIATYEFFSNSPYVAYQMRLAPGFVTELGDDIFAFRSASLYSNAAPIPFRLSIATLLEHNKPLEATTEALEKEIGIKEGSSREEKGIIYVSFPTASEGFNLKGLPFGSYEAAIAVEVTAD
ncbi:MAG: hypothetical protein WDA17_01255 [Sphaerochaetaceae bacterium]|jgi:hypothetical protein